MPTVSKLNYQEPDNEEKEYLKKRNKSNLVTYILVHVFLLFIPITLYFAEMLIFAIISLVLIIANVTRLVYAAFHPKYGVFYGQVTDKHISSDEDSTTYYVSVWSEKDQQYCRNVIWYGNNWNYVKTGDTIAVYKVNGGYHATYPVGRDKADIDDSYADEYENAGKSVFSYEQYKVPCDRLNFAPANEAEKKHMRDGTEIGKIVVSVIFLAMAGMTVMGMYAAGVSGFMYLFLLIPLVVIPAHLINAFGGSCGVFYGKVAEKRSLGADGCFISVWSSKERQYCEKIRWKDSGWNQLKEGDKVVIYKIRNQYFAKYPL